MNAAEVFRLRFQSLLARGLAASEIAARVGLAAASEVWGGDRPRERPAWYVWLRDRPGAWQLELVAAESPAPVDGGAAVVARFTVRHYPSPHAPDLARFSAEERRIAASSLDATGTPRIELASAIPDALFTVGTVEWKLDLDSDAAVFVLASLDRLRTRTRGGEVVRDVPGWRLTAPIFSVLAGLHAQLERRAAERIVVSRQPGFELVDDDGGPAHRDAPEIGYGEAFLAFPPAEAGGESGATLLPGLQDPDAEVVGDFHFGPGVHVPDAIAGDARMTLSVSPSWFGGDAYVQDRVMCAC